MNELPVSNLDVLAGGDSLGVTPDTLVTSARAASDSTLVTSTERITGQSSSASAVTGRAPRNYKPSTATGLTAREYHVLRILDCYGWCTPEMVWHIANFHGVPWSGKGKVVYRLLSRLHELGLVVSRKLNEGTRAIAYAATQDGMAYIRGCGDGLLCDTNTQKDPASIFHFVELNRIMLRLVRQFSAHYWMTDFQVRSDNSLVGAAGLAKDYDSVVELVLPTGHVRFAVEYERWQQSSRRYARVCASLASEKYLHMVIFFLERPGLLKSIAPHFKRLGGFVYFVDCGQFLTKGASAIANYWYLNSLFEAPLRSVLEHHSHKALLKYLPSHQLILRPPPRSLG